VGFSGDEKFKGKPSSTKEPLWLLPTHTLLTGQEVLGLESEETFKVTTGFADVAKRVVKLFLEEEK
jgi:hypothetical protein